MDDKYSVNLPHFARERENNIDGIIGDIIHG